MRRARTDYQEEKGEVVAWEEEMGVKKEMRSEGREGTKREEGKGKRKNRGRRKERKEEEKARRKEKRGRTRNKEAE